MQFGVGDWFDSRELAECNKNDDRKLLENIMFTIHDHKE
jgi:hypothetical protein